MMSTAGDERRYRATGYQVIKSIDIRNFRAFERLRIEDCRRINVIVGENGVGKTALLEAVFLALGVTTDLIMRYRRSRGLAQSFQGSQRKIENAIWADFFRGHDQSRPISISLNGDGAENRSLHISRGIGASLLTTEDTTEIESVEPIVFEWKDAFGREHRVTPTVAEGKLRFPETGEDLPDFFLFPSNHLISPAESAERFSDLDRERRARFIDVFKRQYEWIEDLSIEVQAGAPDIYVSTSGLSEKIAIGNVSGAISRITAILLAIASRPRSIALVDEIENGIHHTHHIGFWKSLLTFAREYDGQLLLTTHNEEWLQSLIDAAGDEVNDIALWRLQRSVDGPVLRQFSGKKAAAGISAGEVR